MHNIRLTRVNLKSIILTFAESVQLTATCWLDIKFIIFFHFFFTFTLYLSQSFSFFLIFLTVHVHGSNINLYKLAVKTYYPLNFNLNVSSKLKKIIELPNNFKFKAHILSFNLSL